LQAASPITFTVQNDKPRITRISSVDYPNNAAGEPSGIGGSIAVNTMGAASVAYKFGSEPSATTNCPTATAGGTGGIALTDANGVATITIPPSLPAGLTNVYVRPFTTSGIPIPICRPTPSASVPRMREPPAVRTARRSNSSPPPSLLPRAAL